jgi:hypothetical protein
MACTSALQITFKGLEPSTPALRHLPETKRNKLHTMQPNFNNVACYCTCSYDTLKSGCKPILNHAHLPPKALWTEASSRQTSDARIHSFLVSHYERGTSLSLSRRVVDPRTESIVMIIGNISPYYASTILGEQNTADPDTRLATHRSDIIEHMSISTSRATCSTRPVHSALL